MPISKLSINGLRIFEQLQIDLHKDLNFIYGDNGTGKSSILESIFLLSRNRSFRTSNTDSLIKQGENSLVIFSGYIDNFHNEHKLGFKREFGKTTYKHNGKNITTLSGISRLVPVQYFGPGSQEFFLGGPSIRRAFLDWGVFHVEHEYNQVYKDYKKVLKNRNQLLKDGVSEREIFVWDSELEKSANKISSLRKSYIKKLSKEFNELSKKVFSKEKFAIKYSRGWSDKKDLSQVLNENLQKDLFYGSTQYGVHRANIDVKVNGGLVKEYLSSGEMKKLYFCLLLSQINIFIKAKEVKPILLIDDIFSELSDISSRDVLLLLTKINAQVIITGVKFDIELVSSINKEHKMFHVEHANVKEVV